MSQTLAAPVSSTPRRGLNIALWVAQVLLGVSFLFGGFTKATAPMDQLATMMPWTAVVGAGLTRFIGVSEFLGGLGLILPSLTRIQPRLTPLAAVGLLTVMLLATAFHVSRGELAVVPINLAMGGHAAFIAWGRTKKAPITPR